MISSVLIVLVLLGLLCQFKKFKLASYALYATTLFLFFSIGCGPLASWLLHKQIDYPATLSTNWGEKNIIILLGAGVDKIPESTRWEPHAFSYGRITKSMELYNACKKQSTNCAILISGGDPKNKGETEAAVYGSVLNQLGLPSTDLILEDKSKNTWQNAQFSTDIVNKLGADTVVLVTSGLHMERSLLYFSHFGSAPIPIRADYLSPFIRFIPNFYNLALADLALSEQIGIARYYLYNFMGWNKAPISVKKVVQNNDD
jgi:uncharacterized SAM-binding protein YcdF (DUF218 family)